MSHYSMNTVFLMLKNQLLLNSGQHILISKTAQKIIENLCMFVNTFRGQGDTIITVKTPNTLYIFYYPHSKIPSPKRQQNDGCLFFCSNLRKRQPYI